ncbi:MAG: hypothetical protein ACN0LA_00805 [Candidatus Longimicrobiales bacterium M2_2A_002]
MLRAAGRCLAALAAVLLVAAAPASAQAVDPGAIRVSVFGGGSVREGLSGLGIAQDVLSLSARVTLPFQGRLQPWVQGELFTRPDLECPQTLECNTDGVTVLAGVVAPVTAADAEPGLHPYFLGGIGWAFSEEDRFAYLLGIGGAFAFSRRIAPSLEVRWEDLPGIRNVMMVNLGVRLDLF